MIVAFCVSRILGFQRRISGASNRCEPLAAEFALHDHGTSSIDLHSAVGQQQQRPRLLHTPMQGPLCCIKQLSDHLVMIQGSACQ